jgi:hypothetical protein
MATPAQAFLHKHRNKLEGKTIALVCTSGSSGIDGTVADARRICPNSIFPEALHIRSANVANARTLLSQWLEKVNIETDTISLTAGNTTFTATLADNSSAKALKELLAKGDIRINMSDYGNMEKVGPLGTTLPRNDEYITTAPGDLILYQGNAFVIYYAPNTWTFTRLGKINNVSRDELIAALGNGNVTVTLSLAQRESTGFEPVVAKSNEYQVSLNLAGDYITVSGEFECLTLLNTNGRAVSQTKENIIKLNKIPAGVYLLRIDAGKRKTVVKKVFINSKT